MSKKYLYNLNIIKAGDIILKRIPNDKISERVRTATDSDYSHAMLYVGDTSYIDVGKCVQARNIQRYLFDDPNDTCLLRLKREFRESSVIERIIEYARLVVGNPLSYRDALLMEEGRFDKFTPGKQLCTRLVAKAYMYAGVQIVDNVEMCTPQDILQSNKLEIISDAYHEAIASDIEFAKSYDVTEEMANATHDLINSLQRFSNGTLRSIDNIKDYIINHPEDDEEISSIVRESGYLDVLESEIKHNRYNYNPYDFVKKYKNNSIAAAYLSIENNQQLRQFYLQQLKQNIMLQTSLNNRSVFFEQQIELYYKLIDACNNRICVCEQVLNIFGLSM